MTTMGMEKTHRRSGAVLCLALALTSLGGAARAASLVSAPFGRTAGGKAVTRYTLTATGGVRVSFISYGGIVTDVTAPDRRGRPAHIVLGFPTLREYETKSADGELYFGAILGRTSNWLNRGRFRLDGHTYQVTLSDPPNTTHGGKKGFDKRLWDVRTLAASGPARLGSRYFASASRRTALLPPQE